MGHTVVEGDVKESSGWHLSERGAGGGREKRDAEKERERAVWPCNYGQTGGEVMAGRDGGDRRRRDGTQRGEPYNLGGTAPCLLV